MDQKWTGWRNHEAEMINSNDVAYKRVESIKSDWNHSSLTFPKSSAK